ncbi:hypothetical protein EJ03DRAFT_331635 [Teratosphaeria nubilosa]|uniref:RRM domain-containing protein n=1 Tax=Teratosphaeria nubilosa TaxID=161662 RepID=A0A6G1KWM8_9PEZI|nr:hypothetical protein EJ03DRAFT_331635 [Teratosphaeria nubilosa]
MANKKNAVSVAASFDEALQASRKERNMKLAQEMLGKKPQMLAQEMLGKSRRSSASRPSGPTPASSLAARAGITKRSNSLPRSHAAPVRQPRQPSRLSRPPPRENTASRPRPRPAPQPQPTSLAPSDPDSDAKSNGLARAEENSGPGLNIRGAARGPWVVRASNFAPGTTAADIESVMFSTGGKMNYCRLVSSAPTVIAEMSFVEHDGAEKVIEMFNNKKADGRLLHVHYADGRVTTPGAQSQRSMPEPPEEEPLQVVVDTTGDVVMEVDEHAEAREAENRQREERRGRDDRGPDRRYPDPPRDDYYHRGSGRAEPAYQDARYGFGGDRGWGGRGAGRGGYRDGPRMYDRRGGSQSYRP